MSIFCVLGILQH